MKLHPVDVDVNQGNIPYIWTLYVDMSLIHVYTCVACYRSDLGFV
jgi:hypothetical protein